MPGCEEEREGSEAQRNFGVMGTLGFLDCGDSLMAVYVSELIKFYTFNIFSSLYFDNIPYYPLTIVPNNIFFYYTMIIAHTKVVL